MDEISFKKGAEVYVAEYTSEGRTMVQIQGVKSGRLSISQFIDSMEPVAMDTVNFTNSVIEINVPAGMKVRLLRCGGEKSQGIGHQGYRSSRWWRRR